LYNWNAATDSRKLCPTGCHVPSKNEWNILSLSLGGDVSAGGKMKSTSSLWTSQSPGANNSSDFTVLPGGWRGFGSQFINDEAYFWSSSVYTGIGPSASYYSRLAHSADQLFNWRENYYFGLSVRCLKD